MGKHHSKVGSRSGLAIAAERTGYLQHAHFAIEPKELNTGAQAAIGLYGQRPRLGDSDRALIGCCLHGHHRQHRQTAGGALEIVGAAQRIVEVIKQERCTKTQQQTDHQRKCSGAHRRGLHWRGGQLGIAHALCATGGERGVYLQLIEALLKQRLLINQHAALSGDIGSRGGSIGNLLIERIDLRLQFGDLLLQLGTGSNQRVHRLLTLDLDVGLHIRVGQHPSSFAIAAANADDHNIGETIGCATDCRRRLNERQVLLHPQ